MGTYPFVPNVGAPSEYPASLYQKLLHLPLLAGIEAALVARLIAGASWFSLPGGMLLERSGENYCAMFVLITGRLTVFIDEPDGTRRTIGHVHAGETIGEMSVLSGEPPMAEVAAVRDSELLRVEAPLFRELMALCPKLLSNITQGLIQRLATSARRPDDTGNCRTVAIVPLQDHLEDERIGDQIVTRLNDMGYKAAILRAADGAGSTEWLNRVEASHEFVVYRGDSPRSFWTNLCRRQADRVFLLARADRPLGLDRFVADNATVASSNQELLLLHPRGRLNTSQEGFAFPNKTSRTCFHVRAECPGDVGRLARFIAGRAVGFVLGGGGARGFAHIGVAKALNEAGVPFDRLGGTSMGAIIAAGLAAEWSIDELSARMSEAFVQANPLSDYTLPLIALVRGRKVSQLLRNHFGTIRIEELPKPFLCVSSDLSAGQIHIHQHGFLWHALRASISLPGILPPVTMHRHLLVDGGVMNNLPVDLMPRLGDGPIIASDVSGQIDLQASDEHYGERPVWRVLWQRMRGTPSIVSILMRSATVGSEAQRRVVREQASLLFQPRAGGVGLRDWKMFDSAIAAGYTHAAKLLEQQENLVSRVFLGPEASPPT
jgi:NTE family protein